MNILKTFGICENGIWLRDSQAITCFSCYRAMKRTVCIVCVQQVNLIKSFVGMKVAPLVLYTNTHSRCK